MDKNCVSHKAAQIVRAVINLRYVVLEGYEACVGEVWGFEGDWRVGYAGTQQYSVKPFTILRYASEPLAIYVMHYS